MNVWLDEHDLQCELFSWTTTTTTIVESKPAPEAPIPEAPASTDQNAVVKAMKVETLSKPSEVSPGPDCVQDAEGHGSFLEQSDVRDQLSVAAAVSISPAAGCLVSSTVGSRARGSGGLDGLEALASGVDV